jgi:hypothetical protein
MDRPVILAMLVAFVALAAIVHFVRTRRRRHAPTPEWTPEDALARWLKPATDAPPPPTPVRVLRESAAEYLEDTLAEA